MFNRIIMLIAFLCLPIVLWADSLIPCPDCTAPVSPRAVFCPSCGCPGEAIAECARNLQGEQPRAQDQLLRLDTDGQAAFAFPVEMADGFFAVAPLAPLLSAESLTLSFLSTNAIIAYTMPEVAVDAPLVRFPITETNLFFWCVAPQQSIPAATLDYSETAGFSFSRESTAHTLADVSAATNLISIYVESAGRRFPQRITDTIKWQRIQPKIFREQSRLFLQILRGENTTPPDKWCHPVFDALLQSNQTQEK